MKYLRKEYIYGTDNYYNLKVHIVLVTKYRKQLLKDSIADDVKQKIFDIANEKVISHVFLNHLSKAFPSI